MAESTMQKRILLVSGIPCSGKSKYGKWLEQEKDFLHLDVESEQWRPEQAHLRPLWDQMFIPGGSVVPFIQSLRRTNRHVLIDWGFRPNYLCFWAICALQKEGVEVWWFGGDWEAARKCFEQRAKQKEGRTGRDLERRINEFNTQETLIKAERLRIQDVVGPKIIEAIKPNGDCTEESVIFERMFANEEGI